MKQQTYKRAINIWSTIRKFLIENGYEIKSGAVDYKNFSIIATREGKKC